MDASDVTWDNVFPKNFFQCAVVGGVDGVKVSVKVHLCVSERRRDSIRVFSIIVYVI